MVRKAARLNHLVTKARRRLQELTFGMFNVPIAASKGVSGIGHIDILLRKYAAKGCDVIGLQATKKDGILEIMAAGYRVYFSSDCSGVNGRKGNMELDSRLMRKYGSKDGTTIESTLWSVCFSAGHHSCIVKTS